MGEALVLIEELVVGRDGVVDGGAPRSSMLSLHTENWRAGFLSSLEARNADQMGGLALDHSLELWLCAGLRPEEEESRVLHTFVSKSLMEGMTIPAQRYALMLS